MSVKKSFIIFVFVFTLCGVYFLSVRRYKNHKNDTVNKPTINLTKVSAAEVSKGYSNLDELWHNFRNNILANNYNQLVYYVDFPLNTRGDLDDDPIITFKKDEFKKVFTLFLKQPSGESASDFNETQLDYIRRTE